MLKHHVTIATGLAALLVLPPTLGQDGLQELERALSEIGHAIDVMTGIQKRIEADPQQAVDLVLATTETPHLEPLQLDDRLTSLRKEVSLLQMELDTLESPGAAMTLEPFVHPPAEPGARPTRARPVTTGLDDSLRGAIERNEPVRTKAVRESSPGRTAPAADEPAPEYEGYSADPVGQARVCYRVGRYEQGLLLLEELDDAGALYWRARCLERLDRIDEAMALLERVVRAEGDSYEGQRAAKDLEFLRWKKGFLKELPRGLQRRRTSG